MFWKMCVCDRVSHFSLIFSFKKIVDYERLRYSVSSEMCALGMKNLVILVLTLLTNNPCTYFK